MPHYRNVWLTHRPLVLMVTSGIQLSLLGYLTRVCETMSHRYSLAPCDRHRCNQQWALLLLTRIYAITRHLGLAGSPMLPIVKGEHATKQLCFGTVFELGAGTTSFYAVH